MFLTKNSKSPFYQLIYKVNGKRTSISTGKTTEEDAQNFLENFNPDKPEIDEIKENPVQNPSLKLSVFNEEYIGHLKATKSISYCNSIRYSFNQLVKYLGDIELSKLDIKSLDEFISTTFSRKQKAAHLHYRNLNAALNKAVEWKYITDNPFENYKFPKMIKVFPAFITEDELLEIISKTNLEHLRDIFQVAFYTGMRRAELINMKWDWVDFQQNLITVKCTDGFSSKNKSERIIPISSQIKTILVRRHLQSSHRFVFYRIDGIRLHDETVSRQFKDIIRDLHMNDKIHFHSLRHSFASLLVQKGASLFAVKELLGHEELSTTEIYSHLQQKNLRDAVNLF